MPVAGSDLRQERQDGVADVPGPWDHAPRFTGEQSVCLRVVDLAAHDGPDERFEINGIHLVVRRHHADDVDRFVERALVPRHDRGADAAIALVHDNFDTLVTDRAGPLHRRVARRVVHDVDTVDERGDAAQRPPNQLLLAIRGDDDRDALPLDHRADVTRKGAGRPESSQGPRQVQR